MNTLPEPPPGSASVPPHQEPGAFLNKVHADSGDTVRDPSHAPRLQALGTLSAALAHEMNNLLTPMLGYARLAMQQPDNAALQRKAITRTHDAAERAVRACGAVMSLARGPAATHETHETPVAHAIHAASSILGWNTAAADTHVNIVVTPEDLTTGMQPTALEQVLVNLMQNARHAMGPGGAVEVHAARNTATQQLELTVRDNGPGVPAAHTTTVFEPFMTRQTTRGSEGETPGTGLGLWISRALMEAGGGALKLAPHDPATPGACFCLILPEPRRALTSERRAA